MCDCCRQRNKQVLNGKGQKDHIKNRISHENFENDEGIEVFDFEERFAGADAFDFDEHDAYVESNLSMVSMMQTFVLDAVYLITSQQLCISGSLSFSDR